ncbi:intracellular septation protein A [Streptosporangium album]|uniref:Intracellular septation protein A n=1 Tax=Streptosporangium album TaxID=47479 RepID=A0A7W7RY72_9ACTN|nr:VC0807 family protein [Streptosporangium album]MBB4940420.1 intracellular septation protein A [Streptosporangium album]
MSHVPVALPRLTVLARQAVPKILEGVIAPLAVFYAALAVLGERGALITAVSWVYAGVGWRLIRRVPVPGTMVLAAIAITLRALIGLWTGSMKFFLLQPELGTICISMVFLASVRLNRPLVQKLTLDYIHLPTAVLKHERVRRFFARITLLWAFVLLTNSAVSIWLLVHQSVGTYLLVRTSVVALISGLAVAVSVYAFRRVLRRLHHDQAPALTSAPA